MRISTPIIAVVAAILATPAMAQVGIGLGGQGGINVGAGGNAGVNVGGTLDSVTGTVDRTVGTLDGPVNGTLQGDLSVATAADLRAGTTVSDNRGRRVGVLQSVHGNTAVVVSGNRTLQVPLASLYRSGKGLVTGLSRTELNASASANARANAGAQAGTRN